MKNMMINVFILPFINNAVCPKYCLRMSSSFFLNNYLNLFEVSNPSWICQAYRVEPGRIMGNRLRILTDGKQKQNKEQKLNKLLAVKLPAVKMCVGWPTAKFPDCFFQLAVPIWTSIEWCRRRGNRRAASLPETHTGTAPATTGSNFRHGLTLFLLFY